MQHQNRTDEAQPLDPIALTLAMWLGIIVAVTGLIRLSENAAAQAALAQSARSTSNPALDNGQAPATVLIGFGG